MSVGLMVPEWPAPAAVRAACTLRTGGVSAAPFESLNLGKNVGDEPAAVAENRRRVAAALSLPSEPVWLSQVHGTRVAEVDSESEPAAADAAVSRQRGRVLAIQVADCMPVLFASIDGAVVAAAHAGWRGLSAGVLEAAVAAMQVEPRRILAWLGPAIGAEHFEVGEEVRSAFVAHDPHSADALVGNARGRWQCDLLQLARRRLAQLGVGHVSAANLCTYAASDRCFSYRRDGRTGRMSALIWRP
ncbi:MAG TPA: peptidoglycan editing factor PgeF [Steroidobacteraceae bacterium]|nr:peptidoglycan editing factor PgeF [Steroidobacteraceae bacterium]